MSRRIVLAAAGPRSCSMPALITRQELLLDFMRAVEASGTRLALPAQALHVAAAGRVGSRVFLVGSVDPTRPRPADADIADEAVLAFE